MARKLPPYTDYLAALLALLLASTVPLQARDTSQWRMFKHDLQRTGRSKTVGAQTGAVEWMHPIGRLGIQADFAVGRGGMIYVGSVRGDFYAFRPDGTIKWRHRLAKRQITAAPAIAPDGTIYVTAEDGILHALTPKGDELWHYDLQSYAGPSASPVVGRNGTIYVGTEKLHAIHSDGTRAWIYDTGGHIGGSPAIAKDGTLYLASQGHLIALDKNGTLKWQTQASFSSGSALAIADDGTIYANTHEGMLQAFHPDGSFAWSFPTEGVTTDVPSSPAIGADGTIYLGGGAEYKRSGGYLYAVAPNGSLKWKYFAGCDQTAPSIGGDGTIYFGSDWCGTITALNPDGTVKWTYVNGKVYARTAPVIGPDGTTYAALMGNFLTPDDGGLIAFGP